MTSVSSTVIRVLLFVLSIGFTVNLANALEPLRTFPADAGTIYILRFSPDGKCLASGASGASDLIRIWNVETAKIAQTVYQQRIIGGFWFTSTGKELIVADYKPSAKIWDLSTDKSRLTFPLLESGGSAMTPDEKTLIVSGRDVAATLYDLGNGRPIAILKQSDEPVLSLFVSPDGKTLATGHKSGTVTLWDVTGRKQLHRCVPPENQYIQVIAFSPDSQTLAVGHSEGHMVLWDVKTGKRKSVAKLDINDYCAIRDMAFTPEGKRLVIAGFGYIPLMLWDIEKKEPLPDFLLRVKKPEDIKCLAISPDGKTLATGGRTDKRIKLWSLPPYKPRD